MSSRSPTFLSRLFRGVKHSALLLLWPLTQFALLRYYLHYTLRIRIGWPAITDLDLMVPCLAAFCIFIISLERERPVPFRFQRKMAIFNLTGFFLFATLNLWFNEGRDAGGVVFMTVWVMAVLTVLFSGFAVFTPVSFYVKNRNRVALIPCTFIALSMVIYIRTLDWIWPTLAPLAAHSTCLILKLVSSNAQCHFNQANYLVVAIPPFYISINRGCSGFDALFLFVSMNMLLLILKPGMLTAFQWVASFVVGLCAMYVTNILRIVLFFEFGHFLGETWGYGETWVWVKNIFHTNVGWALYLMAMVIYTHALMRFAKFGTAQNAASGNATT
jgi:exosortase/archaeosortase family protein